MGAGKAPISNLLLPSQPPPPPPTPNPRATSRRLLLFSLPLFAIATTANLLPFRTTGAKFASASTIQLNLNSCLALAENFDPVSQAEKEASDAISRRVTEAVELLEKGRELHSQGDFNEALLYFTKNMEGLGEHCLFTRLGTEKKQLQKWKISQYL
ncbi:uncharacterized protein LOC133673568 isoform X3 [Populus nigra]|uniref:uncharacterized protein LOC133673568 isoform X3 n=1 Tax=Populus nigra TaxID=3691 RepID=UPI002B27B611|nr:uncharacterized protein LOC133673568 isoform X3 [Populus nigra]